MLAGRMGARRPGGAALGTGWRGAGEAELLLGEVRRGEPRGGTKDGGGDESGRRRARDGIGEGAAVVAVALTEATSGGGAGEEATLGR